MLDTTTQPEASPSGLSTSVTLRSSIKPIYFCMFGLSAEEVKREGESEQVVTLQVYNTIAID